MRLQCRTGSSVAQYAAELTQKPNVAGNPPVHY